VPTVDHALEIAAEPATIIAAFFSPEALAHWWRVNRSVTTPRVLGVYALEWPPTPFEDHTFGPLGGVLHGTVVDYRADREFLVAEVHWLPPAHEPLGPMALHVSCSPAGTPPGSITRVRILQTGGDESPRWKRYYQIMAAGWTSSLAALKVYLESQGRTRPPSS
jgi:uncharacterized protein YndB with AHSA1/START domain